MKFYVFDINGNGDKIHVVENPSDNLRSILNYVKNVKLLSSDINFGCNFDSKGLCVSLRAREGKQDSKEKMCCCRNCYLNGGYMKNELILKEDMKTYKKLFKKKVGFWRKGVGCSLPRELRSNLCLFYKCIAAQEAVKGNYFELTNANLGSILVSSFTTFSS